MTELRRLKLHDGQVLWPEHKPLAEVLELRDTTPEYIWYTTYQGSPRNPGGNVFKSAWWERKNRFLWALDIDPPPVARYISFDTAASEDDPSAYTAWAVGDLTREYVLRIMEMGRRRLAFPQLVSEIESVVARWQSPLLSAVIIEQKSTGKSAIQTITQSAPVELSRIIKGYNPLVDKVTRWQQAAVWCNLGCVLLPWPGGGTPWLHDAEDELFNVPDSPFLDQADAFAQLILYTENLLAAGYRARSKK